MVRTVTWKKNTHPLNKGGVQEQCTPLEKRKETIYTPGGEGKRNNIHPWRRREKKSTPQKEKGKETIYTPEG